MSPVTTRIVVPTVLKALLVTQEKAILSVVPTGVFDRLTNVPVSVIGGEESVICPGPGPLSFFHKVVTPGPIVLITEKMKMGVE